MYIKILFKNYFILKMFWILTSPVIHAIHTVNGRPKDLETTCILHNSKVFSMNDLENKRIEGD